MVLIVQHVQQIAVERVHVIDSREVFEDSRQLFVPRLLRVLHLAHVKLANARDGVARVDDRRRLSLRAAQDDVDEIARRGHARDLLKVVLHRASSRGDGRRSSADARRRVRRRGRGGGGACDRWFVHGFFSYIIRIF